MTSQRQPSLTQAAGAASPAQRAEAAVVSGPERRDLPRVAQAEREFLNASVAVWREIDRLNSAGPYLRLAERTAWERYRDLLDSDEDEQDTPR